MADDAVKRAAATAATGAPPAVTAATGTPQAATAASGAPHDDWAAETAQRLDQLVGSIRSQTTDRIVSIARLLVYGLLAAILGLMAAVVGVVMVVRFADEFIPQEVWLTYFVLGAIFLVAGAFCWSKRKGRDRAA